ncbi:hypothetical protein [Actinomadura kijaniata]|uniref:hypothetical protein n=1 Tax=Actinomadura kijaniata TaxID=46161 RepID=UPI0008352B15|nr:hypothetical protein [Actinomadura kijaniata]
MTATSPPPISPRRLEALRALTERGTKHERATAAAKAAPYADLPDTPTLDGLREFLTETFTVSMRGGYGTARREAAITLARAHDVQASRPPAPSFWRAAPPPDEVRLHGRRPLVEYLLDRLPTLLEQIEHDATSARRHYRAHLRRLPDHERPAGIESACRAWTKDFFAGWADNYALRLYTARIRELPAAAPPSGSPTAPISTRHLACDELVLGGRAAGKTAAAASDITGAALLTRAADPLTRARDRAALTRAARQALALEHPRS